MTVPIPPAVIRIARPEPPTSSTSAASTTSPTLVMPMHSTAAVELPSSARISGRPASSRTPSRACANRDGGRSSAAPRLRRRALGTQMPREQHAAEREARGVEGEQPVGGHHGQQQRGDRGAEREPEVVDRAEQAHRGGPAVVGREPREPGQRGGGEQRGADAGQRGGEDHRREPVARAAAGRRRRSARRRRASRRRASPTGPRARRAAGRAGSRAAGRAAARRRPPRRTRSGRRRAAAAPRRRGRSRGRTARARGRSAGWRRPRAPPAAGYATAAAVRGWKRRGTIRDPHATCTQHERPAEDQQVADAVDVVHRPRGRRGDDVAEERELGMRERRPSCRTRPFSTVRPIEAIASGSDGMTPPLTVMQRKLSSAAERDDRQADDPPVGPREGAEQHVAGHVQRLAQRARAGRGSAETIRIWIAIAAPARPGLRSSTSASADSRPRASGTDSRHRR